MITKEGLFFNVKFRSLRFMPFHLCRALALICLLIICFFAVTPTNGAESGSTAVVFSLSSPLSAQSETAFARVEIALPKPIAFNPALVLSGQVQLETAAPVVYLGFQVIDETGRKKGFLHAGLVAGKAVPFEVSLGKITSTPDSVPWQSGDRISRIALYSKLTSAGSQNFRVESFQIAESQPSPLLQGTFSPRPAIKGIHPRLLLDSAMLDRLAVEYKANPDRIKPLLTPLDAPWITTVKSLNEEDNAQSFAPELAWLALSYRISGDPAYLERLKPWIASLRNVQTFSSSTGTNGDLMGGHLLVSLAYLYDLTKGQISTEESALIRDLMLRQGRRYFQEYSAKTRHHYEQNHPYTAICGLGLAAMALCDEEPEVVPWALFARNFMDISKQAFCTDGYFFEGTTYWNYSARFQLMFAVALKMMTDEDWMSSPPLSLLPLYPAYMTMPTVRQAFDFADSGPSSARKIDPARWHDPDSVLATTPLLALQRFASNRLAGQVLDWLTPYDTATRRFSAMLKLAWGSAESKASVPLSDIPTSYYFSDHEVISWRQNWTDPGATAIAFKCGPPEGHGTAGLLKQYPSWRISAGHAHPDAGSFIIFSGGKFLANAPGYSLKKQTAEANGLLIDGRGQFQEGTAWQTFQDRPYEQYDKIRMERVWLTPQVMAATGVAQDAYPDDMKCRQVLRHFIAVEGKWIVIRDELSADSPHSYRWLYHTDNLPKSDGKGRWIVSNGERRVILQNLFPVDETRIAPTLVTHKDPEIQQRGYHIEQDSPRVKEFQFLNTAVLQASAENPASIQSRINAPDGSIVLSDGSSSCAVWIQSGGGLRGDWGYVRTESSKVLSAGLCGSSLTMQGGWTLTLDGPGRVTVRRDGRNWQVDSDLAVARTLTLSEPGQPPFVCKLPKGKTSQAMIR